MNGFVLSWMAISGSLSGAAGVLAGRALERPSARREGIEAGKQIRDIELRQEQHNQAVMDAQVARWNAMIAGQKPPAPVVGAHGHAGPCSAERGCW